jgi:hypothetical protein
MTDIANIGFAVDTSQIEKGVASLTKLNVASKSTSSNVRAFSTSMTSAAKIFAGAVAGMNKGILSLVTATKNVTTEQIAAAKQASVFADRIYAAAEAQDKLALSSNRASKSLKEVYASMLKAASAEPILSRINRITGVTGLKNDSAAKVYEAFQTGMGKKKFAEAIGEPLSSRGLTEAQQTSRFMVGGIAAQFQDIAVTAAMGMNPVLIAMQQGTQLSSYLANGIKGLGEAFKMFLGPVTLATVAITGMTAGLIQLVNWGKVGEGILNGLANGFDFLARNSDVLVNSLLATVVAFEVLKSGTILSFFTKMGSVIVGFLFKIETLIKSVYALGKAWILANPYTAMAAGFVLVTILFTKFSDQINQFFGFDFTGIIKNSVNNFIGLFVGAVKSVYGAMKWLWDSVKSLFGGEGPEQGFWATMSGNMQTAVNYDYIGGIADGVSTAATAVSSKLKEWSKNLTENDKKTKKLKEAWEDLKRSATTNIAGLQLEKSLIGAGIYESTYEQTLFDLINQAEEKGIDLYGKDNKIALLEEYAAKTAYLTEQVDAQTQAYDFAKSTVKGFFSDMRQGLKEGQSAWEIFGNAVSNVLDKILDKMLDIGVDYLFQAGSASSKDSWFNTAISSVASWFAPGAGGTSYNPATTPPPIKPTMAANGGVFSNGIYSSPTLFAFAKGGKFGVMGEAGPEAVMPLTRGPDGSLGVRADGGSSAPVIVNIINNSNASAKTERRQTSQGVEIDVLIDEMVAEKMGTPGSSSNNALRAFNNQKLVAR